MTRAVLRFFDLLAPLIRMLGADYVQFRAILETKLILDTRRRSVANPSVPEKKPRNAFAGALVFYAIMGLTLIGVITTATPLVSMTLVNAYIMVMITLALIADFSTVLLDTTDNAILQPRPVDGRTVLMARVAHIVTYLSLLSLSLSLFVLITGAVSIHPAFPLVFLGTLCCSTMLVVSFANVLYLLAMRLTTPERLRDVIAYVQIGMMLLVVGGSQLMPRLVQDADFRLLDISDRAWIYWFPPAWMAGPVDLLAGHVTHVQITLTLLAVLVPLACLMFVLAFVAPQFNRLLQDVDAGPAAAEPARPEGQAAPAPRFSPAPSLGRLLTRSANERAAFELVWHMCGRDRNFKMRTYPSLVFPFIFSIGFFFNRTGGTWVESLRQLPETQKHLLLLYIASVMISGVLMQLRFSPQFEAAWIYFAAPVRAPGEILLGSLKAVMARFIVPGFLVVTLPVLAIWGWRGLPDVAVAFCALLFISMEQALLLARALPFSTSFGAMEMSGRFARSLLMMIVPAVIGFIHFGLTFFPWALVPAGALLLVGAWSMARRYRNTDWSALQTA